MPIHWLVDPDGLGRQAVACELVQYRVVENAYRLFSGASRPSVAEALTTRIEPRYRVVWHTGDTSYLAQDDLNFKPQEAHQAPQEWCACGFYAYLSADHEEAAGNGGMAHVLGIVKGYGRTLLGTKGFRCEKAEIVAILDPRANQVKSDLFTGNSAIIKTVNEINSALVPARYPLVPVMQSRKELLEFAPLGQITWEANETA